MGLSSKRIMSVAMAAALTLPAAPAFAASCNEGGNWRSAGVASGSQTFRLEARNRSSADVQGRFGTLADDWTYYDVNRSYERIKKLEYRRDDLVDGRQSHKDSFALVNADGVPLASCAYEYQVRNKTTTQQSRSRTAAQIRYVRGECTAAEGYKVSCERNYSPDNKRLKVSVTLRDN